MCATEIEDTACQTRTSAKLLFVDIDMHIALYITITFDMTFLFLKTAKKDLQFVITIISIQMLLYL